MQLKFEASNNHKYKVKNIWKNAVYFKKFAKKTVIKTLLSVLMEKPS